MSWDDRLQEAAYISPSSKRIVFTYEDVAQEINKLTTAYDFPDGEGTFVQDLGHTGRRYPLRVIFWGEDHDLDAKLFEDALLERGRGTLEHPIYGTIRVVPFGTIERVDRLKTQANQTVFEVTFWESTQAVFPTDQSAPDEVSLTLLGVFNDEAASSFETRAEVDSAVERATFREQLRAVTNAIRSAVGRVADKVADVKRQFDAIFNSINNSLDALVGTPLTLAFQILELAEAPARAAALISDKLDAYRNLADDIFNRALPILGLDNTASNEFLSLDLTAQSAVAASALSILETDFTSQPEAIDAADRLAQLMDDFTEWREQGFDSVEEIDTGEAYSALQELVASTLQTLVSIALDLPQERVVTLDRARNLIELVGEFYGEIDERLDEFIDLNRIVGEEIIEIPIGRVVRYYV